jgi:hypothetical protein
VEIVEALRRLGKAELLLEWVLGCLVAAMGLPVALIALLLLAVSRPIAGAVDHGELFLAAANGVVVGVVTLLTRSAKGGVEIGILALLLLLLLAVPSYLLWAYMTMRALAQETYNLDLAVRGGWGFAIVGAIASLGMVVIASRFDTKEGVVK